jgi:hypothetical protein
MKQLLRIATIAAALALAATPAFALAGPSQSGSEHGNGHAKGNQEPGPKAPLPQKAKAYGVYCKDQSRKHEKGQKGTDFSRCVTAMARAAHNDELSAREACKAMSKKHSQGEKGTPFSRCTTAVAKLRMAESS